ncbi:BON domain-containing protein [Micromonospora polyrhachis]|uniref:Osmotically-inducible protein OsmY n=1 Tax=Micromonospora polyrhachis TaxID=1282883 RepID=A0A7W7SSH2_9ACTN|nr:BON domain-containing protein [Micromonospora polyrhachis]MBB4960157.1 osmotically-inducible protein OsmY [Micromonospora polyrhachis]
MITATMTRSDEEIQRDVLEELSWDAWVQPNEVGVSVHDGIVTLTGAVDSYAKKWAAEHSAHRLHGVRAVANEIEVQLPGSAERSDTDIALAASRALEWDAFVPSEKLDVTVANGWVMLRGEAEWGYQRRAAERSVRRLSGVRGVTNLIAVRPPGGPPAPEAVKRDIRDALLRTLQGNVDQITIDVRNDVVVIGGTVRSWMEKEAAERAAWSAPGVSSVDDRLVLAPGETARFLTE